VRILKFAKNKLRESTFGLSLSLFPRRDKYLIVVVLLIQVILGLFDLAGIAVIGILGSLAVSGVATNVTGSRVSEVLEFLNIEQNSIQSQVAILGLIAACFLIVKSILSLYFAKRILIFLSRRSAILSASLLEKYFQLNLESIKKRNSQEVIYSCTSGVGAVMVGIVGAWVNLISDAALLLILGLGLFVVDSLVALIVAVTFVAVAMLLHFTMHRRVQEIGKFQAEKAVESNRKIQEALFAYREILVRNRRSYYANEIGNLQYQLADKSAAMSFMVFVGKYVFEITLVLSGVVISAIQFLTQPAGRAIAILAIFLAASARIMPAVLRIQQGILRIRNSTGLAMPTIELVAELKDSPSRPSIERSFPTDHSGFVASTEVINLDFTYAANQDFSLSKINFEIKPGEFVAFVGTSGSGKSTLVDLMLGILSPTSGEVKISGKNPLDAIEKWPGAIAYVSQDTFLFENSIKVNLALGYEPEEIPESRYWEALSRAHLADFVRQLPGGLDALIGERGTKLSGGQRQRLAIARAFITNPKLLVLDEATSSLDGETELAITESLSEVKGSMTIVTIAHRLSTIVAADHIFLIDKGQLIANGTFSVLKENSEEFRRQAEIMGL
jgi:ABC-type multidrug transport system fused ATPase/permease subunit